LQLGQYRRQQTGTYNYIVDSQGCSQCRVSSVCLFGDSVGLKLASKLQLAEMLNCHDVDACALNGRGIKAERKQNQN